jgi:hypothetical protein
MNYVIYSRIPLLIIQSFQLFANFFIRHVSMFNYVFINLFHNWHPVTDWWDDETWDDQNDDGETKTIFEFVESGLQLLR